MKKMIRFCCVLLFFSGCGETKDSSERRAINFQTIKVDTEAKEQINLSVLVDTIEYIPLETRPGSLIGQVSKLVKYESNFFILDKKKARALFCFDEQGKFLFQVGREGKGPGEYGRITNFTIDYDRKEVMIYDEALKKILAFSLDGEFKSEYPLALFSMDFTYLGEGAYAYYCSYIPNKKEKGKLYNLYISDIQSEISHRLFPFDKGMKATNFTHLSQNFKRVNADTVSLLTPYNDTLYYVTPSGSFPKYVFDFGDKIPEEFYAEVLPDPKGNSSKTNSYIKKIQHPTLHNILETKHILYASYHINGEPRVLFYDKKSKKKVHAPFALHNDIDGGGFLSFHGGASDSFYTIVDALLLTPEYRKMLPEKLVGKFNPTPGLQKFLSTVSPEDNPIIVVSRIKESLEH